MILKSVQVQKFKSINDSSSFKVQRGATAMVGKNETAILEAIYRLNSAGIGGHKTEFDELYDYPRARRNADRESIPHTCPVTMRFELELADQEALEARLGQGSVGSRVVSVSKNYDNVRLWEIEINEPAVISKLVSEHEVQPDLVKNCTTIVQLREGLAARDERTDAVNALFAAVEKLDPQEVAIDVLEARLPKMVYFDDYSTLPGTFSIPYLQEKNEQELKPGERTALALLRLAGVETAEFTESEYEARKAALEAAANQITDEVFEYWSQNQDLTVEFDLDFQAPDQGEGRTAPFLHIRIRNPRHRVTLDFDNRSRGFVWFFSFLAAFSEYRDRGDRLIVLLDEPGLGLHAAAQEDLRRFIDERVASEHQLVYTTHSPFMIELDDLNRVRAVEDFEGRGTVVTTEMTSLSADTVSPHSSATYLKSLGADDQLLAKLMGHRDARSVQKYAKLDGSAIRAGLERLHRRGRGEE